MAVTEEGRLYAEALLRWSRAIPYTGDGSFVVTDDTEEVDGGFVVTDQAALDPAAEELHHQRPRNR